MLPILFRFGPITVYSWGFFLAASYLVATFILWREGKRQGYNEEKLLDLSIFCLVAAIIFGRAVYVLLNRNIFGDEPVSVLYFWQGGFVYYGVVLGVAVSAFYFVRSWKWSFFQIADIGALSATAALILVNVGSFLAGSSLGKETSLPWAVKFPGSALSRHPVQIYEAATYFLIFLILYPLYFRNLSSAKMKSGKVFFPFIILASLNVAVFEFLKVGVTTVYSWPVLSISGLVIAIISIFALYYFHIRELESDRRQFSKVAGGVGRFVFGRIRF
jgi:phosphatidylglycerol:prolipoprotein diacylglycerol transferase